MTGVQDGADRRSDRVEEISSLTRVSESLERTVTNLADALKETGAIQQRQVELDLATQAAAEAARLAQQKADQALPREEQEAKEAEKEAADKARRRKSRRRVSVVSLIAVIVVAALTTALGLAIHSSRNERHDFTKLRAGLVTRCEATNKQTKSQVEFSKALSDLLTGRIPGQPVRPVPPSQQASLNAATKAFDNLAASQPKTVNCAKLYGTG